MRSRRHFFAGGKPRLNLGNRLRVMHMPGANTRHNTARIEKEHRRCRCHVYCPAAGSEARSSSRAARVFSTVSGVSAAVFPRGTATTNCPRRCNRTGVAAGSISMWPSRQKMSNSTPGVILANRLISRGITILPALSMVVFMVISLPYFNDRKIHRYQRSRRQQAGKICRVQLAKRIAPNSRNLRKHAAQYGLRPTSWRVCTNLLSADNVAYFFFAENDLRLRGSSRRFTASMSNASGSKSSPTHSSNSSRSGCLGSLIASTIFS